MTMTLISTITVGAGGATGMDFTSIPQTYTDLFLVVSARTGYASVQQDVPLYFNSNGSGYTLKKLYGTGSGVGTNSTTGPGPAGVIATGSNATSNNFGNCSVYITNYTGSTYKSYSIDSVLENNATSTSMELQAGLWSNTAAITGIAVSGAGQTFVQYSTVSLYGITKGSGGATVS